MIKDQPSKIENKLYETIETKRSQGRSHDYSDYIRTLLAFGLVGSQGPGFMPGLFNWRILMEIILLDKVAVLEMQLNRTEDAWLKRIWTDHINDLMRKVARIKK